MDPWVLMVKRNFPLDGKFSKQKQPNPQKPWDDSWVWVWDSWERLLKSTVIHSGSVTDSQLTFVFYDCGVLATTEFWIVSSCAWHSTCLFNAKHLKKVTPFPQVTASSHELILHCCVLKWIIVYSAYSIFRECSVDPSLLSLLSLVRVTNMTVELVMNTYFIPHRQDILVTNHVTTGQEIFSIKLIMCNLYGTAKHSPDIKIQGCYHIINLASEGIIRNAMIFFYYTFLAEVELHYLSSFLLPNLPR